MLQTIETQNTQSAQFANAKEQLNYVLTKEEYLQLKEAWSKNTTHTAADMIIYNVLRGFESSRGFVPLTRPEKINSNHGDAWHGYNVAVYQAKASIAAFNSKYKSEEEINQINATRAKQFEAKFGIPLTEAIKNAIDNIELKG